MSAAQIVHASTRTAIDLFAGAGGATQGLAESGIRVLGAVEIERHAAASYRANHADVRLWQQDIRSLPAQEMRRELGLEPGELTLLKACPPCQGFSSLADGGSTRDDPRNELVVDTVRFVRAFRPKIVLVENVRGLARDPRSERIRAALGSLGYSSRNYLVDATDFGVPQRRKRFIMLAVRGKRRGLPDRLDTGSSGVATVRTAFSKLERQISDSDPLHEEVEVSEIVRRRIEAVPIGGDRFDLPTELQLECHRKLTGGSSRGASGSYGRLKWDEPAPTMTTRCTTPACGSFIHPDLNRPITLREAAAIQTFPADYKFVGGRVAVASQIGNAVPILMARNIASAALQIVES